MLKLVDQRFYHLDTCFCPLEGGFAMYYPPAFDEASRAAIEKRVPAERRIAIGEEDALAFACNAVNIDCRGGRESRDERVREGTLAPRIRGRANAALRIHEGGRLRQVPHAETGRAMRPFVLACLVALPLAAAAQQMYKWVDEKGVTHYSDSPPPDGKADAKKIDIRPVPPSAPVAAPPTWQQKEEQDVARERVQKVAGAAEGRCEDSEGQGACSKERCIEAQRQLQMLAGAAPGLHGQREGREGLPRGQGPPGVNRQMAGTGATNCRE